MAACFFLLEAIYHIEGSRRTGHGISRPSAQSGKTCRGVEQSLRAAPDPAVGGVFKR